MLILDDLIKWLNEETKCGNRIKASKLYKAFHKYAKLKYPDVTGYQLVHYDEYVW